MTAGYSPGEVAVDQGAHTAYALAHQSVIDTYHGKLTGEDYLVDSQNRSYRVNVYVNGAQKTEQDPHPASGGDYTINYTTGVLTFLAALQPTDVVTVDYHYMVDSTFIVAPDPGKNLLIDSAEASFTTDIGITDSVVFQPYGLVDVFAPQLMPGVPSGTKIPLGSPVIYKTIGDYHNDAAKAYPTYPAMGGNTWRGLTQPMVVMAWDYQASTTLLSQAGMEVRIWLQHHTPFTGTFGTATFYCISTSL